MIDVGHGGFDVGEEDGRLAVVVLDDLLILEHIEQHDEQAAKEDALGDAEEESPDFVDKAEVKRLDDGGHKATEEVDQDGHDNEGDDEGEDPEVFGPRSTSRDRLP